MATASEEAVFQWTTTDVFNWLQANNFGQYSHLLCTDHKIDGVALLCLTEDDLRKPPLQLGVVGDIKRLGLALKRLQMQNPDLVHQYSFKTSPEDVSYNEAIGNSLQAQHRVQRLHSEITTDDEGVKQSRESKIYARNLKPEYQKLLLSFFYMFMVFILTAFVMVIVHDRVPNMDKYPPLPDLALDNIPLIPWAFEMCELTGLILALVFWTLMIFHKHRFIIMRRLFSLTGTVFLLRCVCMLITSLSVPGTHLQCQPKIYGELEVRMQRTLEIFLGFGMSMQGVRTCGDYMFSGHTVVVTMLNFFISEYTPSSFHILHSFSWIMNIFGIFFILAAHEHYSIDVFIAFYITSRLFLYYHSLANNRALTQPDRRRMHMWFPMFSYFEANVVGMVPNDYELPWQRGRASDKKTKPSPNHVKHQ